MMFTVGPFDDDAPISVSNLRIWHSTCGSEILVKHRAIEELAKFTCSKCNFEMLVSEWHTFILKLLSSAIANAQRGIEVALL